MGQATFINRIGRAVPPFDFHRKFLGFAPLLLAEGRGRQLFRRMAERCGIEHRYTCLVPSSDPARIDDEGFYRDGSFPDTAQRMARYDEEALPLAVRAIADLGMPFEAAAVTHLVIVSCTGFAAPGLDLQLLSCLGLPASVERTMVGFMGCSAAIPALKLARHIVRSEPDARVLVIAIELCSLHLRETRSLEEVLSFLLFADGCAAALVSGEPYGIEIDAFGATVLPDTIEHISWRVGAQGFAMHLSGQVPSAILHHLRGSPEIVAGGGARLWAVHAGGRTVLDAVERGLRLPPEALDCSRRVLRDFGNMSSATVLFVLREMMDRGSAGRGCALAFGPGISVETMTFTAPR